MLRFSSKYLTVWYQFNRIGFEKKIWDDFLKRNLRNRKSNNFQISSNFNGKTLHKVSTTLLQGNRTSQGSWKMQNCCSDLAIFFKQMANWYPDTGRNFVIPNLKSFVWCNNWTETEWGSPQNQLTEISRICNFMQISLHWSNSLSLQVEQNYLKGSFWWRPMNQLGTFFTTATCHKILLVIITSCL